MVRLAQGHQLTWNCDPALQEYFENFAQCQSNVRSFDYDAMPLAWQQAQTVLSICKLQIELVGLLGAASIKDLFK